MLIGENQIHNFLPLTRVPAPKSALAVTIKPIFLLACLLVLAAGCVRYHPKPIEASRSLADYATRRLDSPELKSFLQSKAGVKEWPPQSWDLRALTLAAYYYSPDLDIARAQWAAAKAGRITAGERPNPTISGLMGYNSTSPVSEVSPWIPEISLEIPVETAGKRGFRILQARQLSEAARLNIISAAWDVRSRLRQALLDLYAAGEAEKLFSQQLSIQESSVRILEAQMNVGEVSAYDVTQSRIARDNSRLAAVDAAIERAAARIRLAAVLGVPTKALDGANLSFEGMTRVTVDLPSSDVQRRALVSRSDILAALAQYEAAQAALRVEIARQYPDLSLGPNYQFDQTDNKWTLGLSLILPLLNQNKGPIAEAEARRAEAASQFLALQARVIAEVESAVMTARAAADKAGTAETLLINLKKQEAAAQARFDVGEISRLELLGIEQEIAAGALARLDALVKAQQAAAGLESAMQSPIDLKEWVLDQPDRSSRATKEHKDE
jgi:cobalt-zinc-cadmium efflux system outer membrane protein